MSISCLPPFIKTKQCQGSIKTDNFGYDGAPTSMLTSKYGLNITPFPLKHSSDHAIFVPLVFHRIYLHNILGVLFCGTVICLRYWTTGWTSRWYYKGIAHRWLDALFVLAWRSFWYNALVKCLSQYFRMFYTTYKIPLYNSFCQYWSLQILSISFYGGWSTRNTVLIGSLSKQK